MAMKPKPRPGLKKDGSSMPSQIGQMRKLNAKITGNTTTKKGIPDNKGEARAMKELAKIGKRMGIGNAADVQRYLRVLDKNTTASKAKSTAKAVSSQRMSDKMTKPPKKVVTKKK